MKRIQTFQWIFVCVAGMILTGCGGVEDGSIMGPGRASKVAVTPQGSARAGVSVLLWNHADGRLVADAEVSFARSVSGRNTNYQWTATTDADGIAQLDLVAPPETPNRNRGMSGYYIARATDPVTGEVLGTWASIPLNGGKEHIISLPIGGPITISSGQGPLDQTGMGRWSWAGPISGIPGSLEAVNSAVIQRNTNGDAWGLIVGYEVLRDVNPFLGQPAPGLELNFPQEASFPCWRTTGEGDSFQFKWGITKSPDAPFFVGLQSIGRVTYPGDGTEPRFAFIGANLVAPGEFDRLSCEDDFAPLIEDAIDAGTAIDYEFDGTFRIIRH